VCYLWNCVICWNASDDIEFTAGMDGLPSGREMNIQIIGSIVFIVIVSLLTAIPVYVSFKRSREEALRNIDMARVEFNMMVKQKRAEAEIYKQHEVTVAPMSLEEIEKIDFGPAAYNNVVPANYSGEYNVAIGYTDADGRVPESPVMIGGIICEHCGRINSRESYYCDGCRASIYESQARADRIALRY